MALFPWRRPRVLTGRYSTRYDREVRPPRFLIENEWRGLWRETAEGVGLSHLVHVAAGVTVSTPAVGAVRIDATGRVSSATIRRRAGQRVADYRALAPQLADALGCACVLIEDLGRERWIRLRLLDHDPLDGIRGWHRYLPEGHIADTETGTEFSVRWDARPHTVVQGSTGSGKSSWTYGQLARLALLPLCPFTDLPAVRVVGLDPSGLLWRPWPADPWRVSGLVGDLAEHRRVLRELCTEMDRRLADLPTGVDNLRTHGDTPLLVVVLEEYAALVRAAELVDRRVGQEVRQLVGRLFSEGRKVGVRLLLILQRADASIIDGAIRAQATLRVSFASEADGIAMLHPRHVIDPDEHATAEPGVCAITAPRAGTFRARSPLLTYADYVAVVATRTTGANG